MVFRVTRFVEKLLWTMKVPENLKSPEKERYEVMEQFRGQDFDGMFKSDNFGNAFHIFCLYLLCGKVIFNNYYKIPNFDLERRWDCIFCFYHVNAQGEFSCLPT